MSNLIREVASRFPESPPQVISTAVVGILENAIDESIRKLVLPPTGSPVDAALERIMLRRLRSERRHVVEEKRESFTKLVGELHRLQYLLDGHELSSTSLQT